MVTKAEMEQANKELETGLAQALQFNKDILKRDNETVIRTYVSLLKMSTALFFFYMIFIMSAIIYLKIIGG